MVYSLSVWCVDVEILCAMEDISFFVLRGINEWTNEGEGTRKDLLA